MKTICHTLALTLLVTGLSACYDDEGNYNYTEVPEITVSGIPENPSVYKGVEPLTVAPTLTSSTEGEIAADNPNYEYACRIAPTNGSFGEEELWHDINPAKTQSFTYDVKEPVGTYLAVYSVTDKRTGVTTHHRFTLSVSSSTYEGWMVLCNEGSDNRARLDMVSLISTDRIATAHDLLAGSPVELNNARHIGFDHNSKEDYIYLMTESGSYRLDAGELTADETGEIVASEFFTDIPDVPVRFAAIPSGTGQGFHLLVTSGGDAYLNSISDDAAYQFLANTSENMGDREYRVAPYIGVPMKRTYQGGPQALFYDIDNRRFLTWFSFYDDNRILKEIPDKDGAPYSFSNVGKDLVYMESTRFGGSNTIFSVMQDEAGQRSVYTADLNGPYTGDVIARQLYDGITAEGFHQAAHYAFHSQFPYVFYASGSRLYTYGYEARTAPAVIDLPGEDITMVKMNIYSSAKLANVPEEKDPWQYYVLVGSYRRDAADDNGGILRMYRFDNTTGTLSLVHQYDGFARIVDVTYRERFEI